MKVFTEHHDKEELRSFSEPFRQPQFIHIRLAVNTLLGQPKAYDAAMGSPAKKYMGVNAYIYIYVGLKMLNLRVV